jgi:hypothetical protein
MSGSGFLFFEFYRVLMTLRLAYGNHVFWMYENTAAMPHTIRNDITRYSYKQ